VRQAAERSELPGAGLCAAGRHLRLLIPFEHGGSLPEVVHMAQERAKAVKIVVFHE
jgi:hypothetical protein